MRFIALVIFLLIGHSNIVLASNHLGKLDFEKDGLTTFGTVGTQRSNLMSGKTATYTTNGTAGSYTDSAKSDTYNTVSIGVSYKGSNGMSLTGNVSNSRSNNKVSGAITRLGFNWKF